MLYRTKTYAKDLYTIFYFEKNLQGDIIAVYNAGGTKLASYTYDAWGNCTTTYYNGGGSTAAQYNPFRYRGYYYDTDLGLYYLNSRYYDSNIGRFLNADGIVTMGVGSINGNNLFAYCFNNPVNMIDSSGHWPKWSEDIYYTVKNTAINLGSIVFTREFVDNVTSSTLSNIEASAGICLGMGLAFDIEFTDLAEIVSLEAIVREDIIGIQFKDGKVRLGHNGKVALNIGSGVVSVGPSNRTYEPLGGGNIKDRKVSGLSWYDVGLSDSYAFAFVIGFHVDYSISFSGMATDIVDYIIDRW